MAVKFNLLIVDDDADMVRLLTKSVSSRLGDRFEVVGLTDSAAAMQYCDVNRCHVLISDLEMPGADGLEMLRCAKRHNPWSQVIVVTAHSTLDRMSKAIEHGASDYLLKPIDHKDLAIVLDQAYSRLIRWCLAIQGTLSPLPAATA
jgi:DNA-binding NtrC family response regulator